MQQGSPEQLNRRLGQVEFIGCEADRMFYARLAGFVTALRRPQDTFDVPEVNSPYAWRRCYSIYLQLQAREDHERSHRPDTAEDRNFAASQKNWNDFLADIGSIKELIAKNQIDEIVAEFLDIRRGDLDSPLRATQPGMPNMRRHDWLDVAQRLSKALREWGSLSAFERQEIPSRLKSRRQDRRIGALEQRVAALEA